MARVVISRIFVYKSLKTDHPTGSGKRKEVTKMTKVQKGDVIRLKYTGRIKETGEIFDTTEEEIAKQAGIYKENGVYGPVPIAVGAGHVIQGLDEQLEGLEVGKKYEIEVPPEKGFGKRDPKLIKTFTLGQFRRQGGLIPFPRNACRDRDRGRQEAQRQGSHR